MELVTNLVMAGVGVVASGTAYVVKKVLEVDKAVVAHVAADEATFAGFNKSFKSLEDGQAAQTEKLHRLVEHLLSKS